MIHGIVETRLRYNIDEDGKSIPAPFGKAPLAGLNWMEVREIRPNQLVSWHSYGSQIVHLTCTRGCIKLVLFDPRNDSSTFGSIEERFPGEHDLQSLQIPANIYVAWKTISTADACCLIAGSGDHKPRQAAAAEIKQIPYRW